MRRKNPDFCSLNRAVYPPTGKEVTITGIIITRFESGQAREEWEEANLLGMMQQLGAMPPAPGSEQ